MTPQDIASITISNRAQRAFLDSLCNARVAPGGQSNPRPASSTLGGVHTVRHDEPGSGFPKKGEAQ